ncbi:MAG: carbamoyl-phosphate synthase large subunit, partial [Methanobacterium sp.]|nr:carbamoyl-phosphate synthase large subunit [Euryarchaeota archaeon]MBV1728773.1 carbamoyl-phosphate synthase large subunit [Methanobacterium sp.]
IGRTIEQALHKAIRSLDTGRYGFEDVSFTKDQLAHPTDERLFQVYTALKQGITVDEIHQITLIDKFFLYKLMNILELENEIASKSILDPEMLLKAKKMGFSDKIISEIWNIDEKEVRNLRNEKGIIPTFKMVDTCAAEFEAKTPYYYGTYGLEDEVDVSSNKKVIILGAGPIRIGQGIEFDYCCVHAAMALKEQGIETIIINNNPETVSTDYDISSKLYFEPLTLEDVLNIVDKEKPEGVVVQFGGQTSINLAVPLAQEGVKIMGTPHESIDKVEDRERFSQVLEKLEIPQAAYGIAKSFEDARKVAEKIGFPVLVRPSYVLGGRAMQIVYDDDELREYMEEAVRVSPEHPILVDKFLQDAIEVDVDALCDGEEVFIGGIMEHIEEAGVHSGDSACVIPPQTIPKEVLNDIKDFTTNLALELGVVGLMNIQYAVKLDEEPKLYILEANPRASRTVPFVSKVVGVPLAKIAAMLMMGHKLKDYGLKDQIEIDHVAVKESVFPFIKLPESDSVLGPEMKSTGESMGIDVNFGLSYYKSQLSANMDLPTTGKIFISVRDADKDKITDIVKKADELGFEIVATRGTARAVEDELELEIIRKVSQGSPNIQDAINNGEIGLIINTPSGKQSADDGYLIRRMAIELGIPYITTLAGARAALNAIGEVKNGKITVRSLNEYITYKI